MRQSAVCYAPKSFLCTSVLRCVAMLDCGEVLDRRTLVSWLDYTNYTQKESIMQDAVRTSAWSQKGVIKMQTNLLSKIPCNAWSPHAQIFCF
jgi:hypothetical protein